MSLSPYQQTQLARYGNPRQLSDQELTQLPVEYATGRAEFCGLPLHVSPQVLIPRIETEELVELVLQAVNEQLSSYQTQSILRIAEVGTGSGAISLVLAKHLAPFSKKIMISAGDISPAALAIARKNQAEFLTTQDVPVQFIESDLVHSMPGKFHLIVANLPYIPSARVAHLDPLVKNHEPHLALDGGSQGLTQIYRLLDQAITHLYPGGIVFLEIDDTHSLVDFRQFGQYFEITVFQDSFGKNRFARLVFKQQPYQA